MGLRFSTCIAMACVVFSTAANPALGGEIDVTMWNLSTRLSQLTDSGQDSDHADILTVTNPLNQVVRAQINSSYNESAFSYQWIVAAGAGTFETDITHVVRAPRIDMRSIFQVWILPTKDIRLTIDASLAYSHTPGDESIVSLSYGIRNMSTLQDLFVENRIGGDGWLGPSTGVLSISREQVLSGGIPYRLQYGAGSDNGADFSFPPTGTIDAMGHINFSIEPVVPEPAALTLLFSTAAMTLRRRRR